MQKKEKKKPNETARQKSSHKTQKAKTKAQYTKTHMHKKKKGKLREKEAINQKRIKKNNGKQKPTK